MQAFANKLTAQLHNTPPYSILRYHAIRLHGWYIRATVCLRKYRLSILLLTAWSRSRHNRALSLPIHAAWPAAIFAIQRALLAGDPVPLAHCAETPTRTLRHTCHALIILKERDARIPFCVRTNVTRGLGLWCATEPGGSVDDTLHTAANFSLVRDIRDALPSVYR